MSEQQLVDCAGAFDTQGCDGGLPSHAFEYIKHAGGLSTEFSYPYHAKDQKCTFNASASVTAPQSNGIGIRVPGGSVNLTKGDEGALKYYLATKGPVSVAFDVASDFRDYKSGVYSSTVCSHDAEHASRRVNMLTTRAHRSRTTRCWPSAGRRQTLQECSESSIPLLRHNTS